MWILLTREHLEGGTGTHVGAKTQEDLWLTDKQREDVTEWSSLKVVSPATEKKERKEPFFDAFPTVVKAAAKHFGERSRVSH